MCAFPALTSLELSCLSWQGAIGARMLSRLGCLASLQELALRGWKAVAVTADPQLPALTRLALREADAATVESCRMPWLAQLSVRDMCSVDPRRLSALSALSSLHLAFSNPFFWEAAAKLLEQAPPSLISLELDASGQVHLDSVPQLTWLELCGHYWPDLAPLESLQLLELPDQTAGSLSARDLSELTQLRCLRLGEKMLDGREKRAALKVGRLAPPRPCCWPW